jgi:hypothetical protein
VQVPEVALIEDMSSTIMSGGSNVSPFLQAVIPLLQAVIPLLSGKA